MASKEGIKIITMRVEEDLKFQIELEAHRQGRSVNNFLNFVIKNYIEKENRAKNKEPRI